MLIGLSGNNIGALEKNWSLTSFDAVINCFGWWCEPVIYKYSLTVPLKFVFNDSAKRICWLKKSPWVAIPIVSVFNVAAPVNTPPFWLEIPWFPLPTSFKFIE